MLRLSFGTEREARAVVARINAIHDRVNGRLPEAAGAFPAGTPYSAHDPALLAWVHATLLDMNLRVYELFVGSAVASRTRTATVSRPARSRSTWAFPQGVSRGGSASSGEYMDAMLASGEISRDRHRADPGPRDHLSGGASRG